MYVSHVIGSAFNDVNYLNWICSTFNFSVPFLSYLAIALLVAGSILLYAIPLRYLIMGWGVNKFTRKLLRPHSIPNNELLDFMSRVPDDEQLVKSLWFKSIILNYLTWTWLFFVRPISAKFDRKRQLLNRSTEHFVGGNKKRRRRRSKLLFFKWIIFKYYRVIDLSTSL